MQIQHLKVHRNLVKATKVQIKPLKVHRNLIKRQKEKKEDKYAPEVEQGQSTVDF